MKNEKIINLHIIEDNALYAAALKQFLESNLENFNYAVSITLFKTSEGCIEALNRSKIKPDIIILDYFLNSQFNDAMNGLNALFHLKVFNSEVEVIFLSGQDKMEITVESLRTGAFDYIVKDEFAFQNVLSSVQECLHEIKLRNKNHILAERKSASL